MHTIAKCLGVLGCLPELFSDRVQVRKAFTLSQARVALSENRWHTQKGGETETGGSL